MRRKQLIFLSGAVILAIAILGWLIYISTRPLPGQPIRYECSSEVDFSKLGVTNTDDKCRVHVPVGTEVHYSTNPPVFGPHYAEWTKSGVYSEPQDDRNLVHSLEHGYVILSYKCTTPNAQPTIKNDATLSGKLDSLDECNQRKAELEQVYNKKGKHKLIVVARMNLETDFALTAWGYLDKFNEFEEKRIDKFIDSHLDNGPEKTMEP